MARKVSVLLTDDLSSDEVPADETVAFSLDGTAYEIDLSTKNATSMREALSRYVDAARKVGKPASSGSRRGSGGRAGVDREQTRAVRAWAEAAGLMPPGRKGRIPNEIVDQYHQSHRGRQTMIDTPARSEADLLTDADRPENVAARVTAAKEAAKAPRAELNTPPKQDAAKQAAKDAPKKAHGETAEPSKVNAATKTSEKEAAKV